MRPSPSAEPTGNVDRLRRGYAALNRGDLSGVVALVAADLVWESETGDAGRGRESFRQFLQSWLDNFDGFRADPRDVIERGSAPRRGRRPARTRPGQRRRGRRPHHARLDDARR